MSVTDAKQLYEKVSVDEDLRDQFAELNTEEEVVSKAMILGEELGLDVTADDVKAVLEQNEGSSGELDEAELEAVAGGAQSSSGDTQKWNTRNLCDSE